jgi:hypothetical protein
MSGITLGYIAAHLPTLNVICDICGRHRRYSTAKRVAKYGADSAIRSFQEKPTRDCPIQSGQTFRPWELRAVERSRNSRGYGTLPSRASGRSCGRSVPAVGG